MNKTFVMRLDDNMYEKMSEKAFFSRISIAELARRAIGEFLENE